MIMTDEEVRTAVAFGNMRITYDGCAPAVLNKWQPGAQVRARLGRWCPAVVLGPQTPLPVWNVAQHSGVLPTATRMTPKFRVLVARNVRGKCTTVESLVHFHRIRDYRQHMDKLQRELDEFEESMDTLTTVYAARQQSPQGEEQ